MKNNILNISESVLEERDDYIIVYCTIQQPLWLSYVFNLKDKKTNVLYTEKFAYYTTEMLSMTSETLNKKICKFGKKLIKRMNEGRKKNG